MLAKDAKKYDVIDPMPVQLIVRRNTKGSQFPYIPISLLPHPYKKEKAARESDLNPD